MGAQTEQRLEQFKKRFEEWDDPHNETPPYHYGTHYSSAMIVSSYLVRLGGFLRCGQSPSLDALSLSLSASGEGVEKCFWERTAEKLIN